MNSPTPEPHTAPGSLPPFPQPPAKRTTRAKSWLTHGAVAFVSLIVGAALGGGDAGETVQDAKRPASAAPTQEPAPDPTTPDPVVAETVAPDPTTEAPEEPETTPPPTEEAGPADHFAGDGEYLVGEDIRAGTYKTTGPDGSFGCYWARLKDASGEFDAIIANNNLQGPGRVTLKKGEYFQTQRCQEWKKVG
ncbi:hypothetical protein ACFVU3_06625 [Streptomyces sp. NPDC058052]|uniref:hypothetical protein n=1 Tax=Streptomyces sp. NPDC058052 TaxID=3346316 RepID=UPI0036E1EED2